MTDKKLLCVAGASGLVGSNITKCALAHGYRVNGTMTRLDDTTKTTGLMALPGAEENLTLLQADMTKPGSFDEATEGADCVFIACLVELYSGPSGKRANEMTIEEGYADIIRPTVDACLNIMRSAHNNGVNNISICSSTGSTNPPTPVPIKNELDHWSDEQVQCANKKFTPASKTLMEKAAIQFAEEHKQRLSIFLPTLMLGPALLPSHDRKGFQGSMRKLVEGKPGRHTQIPNFSMSMIHVQDLAELFLAAYETPTASGRYFGVYESWHLQDIYAELAKLLPNAPMPKPLVEEPEEVTRFDVTRRDSLKVPLRDIPTILRETVEWQQVNH